MTFEQLTSNPLLGDGVALFHATHGNLGTAAALNPGQLSLARCHAHAKGLGGPGLH
ncbi:MAG: hypothetical protein IPF71_07030 [Rhodoferax sp.]|nr:hypothetical protein [Rhodoferax sp.]